MLTQLFVLLVLRTHGPAIRGTPSRLLLWSTIAVALVALAAPFLPALNAAFGFVPLSPLRLAAIVAIGALYVAVTERAKYWFYRGRR